jgi:N-acetyl sugar amidotransferase
MRFCKRCLYPENHPLNLIFDDQGVCSGCRIHEEKDTLDWSERGKKLAKIFDRFRNRSGRSYDCVIPVSGARDSYFIVHTVKKVFGMNPLLVSYNKHYNTRIGIRNIAYLKTLFDCDSMMMVVEPGKVKRITRHTLDRIGSMYWHCLAGQTVFPVQVAVRMKIPLIVWGAHQGIDQVGMFSHTDEVEMTRKYRKDHDLMGLEAEDLVDEAVGVSEFDLLQFFYPHDKEIEKVGVRGIYLNNYIRWDSKAQHELMIDKYGYETALQARTFDTYNDVDCFHYSDIHDYIKMLKHGYGKVTDHACREIRLKRMTREQGIDMVSTYGGKKPVALPIFTQWMGMSENELNNSLENFRNDRLWVKGVNCEWRLKDSIVNHRDDAKVNELRLETKESCEFLLTPSREPQIPDDSYILIGRGFVDAG